MFSGLTRGDSSIKQTYLRQKLKEGSSIKVDSNAMGDDYDDILQRVDTRLSLQIAPSADFDEKAIVGDDDQVGVLQLHDNGIQNPKEMQEVLKEEISRLNVVNESLSSKLDEVTNKFETLKKEYVNLVLQRPVDQQRATNIHPIKTLNNYEAIKSRVKLHGEESSDSRQITVHIDDDEDSQSRSNPDLCDTIVNQRDDEHLIKCQKTEDDNAKRGKNNITPWQRAGGAGMSPPTADIEENHEVTMRRARVSVRIRSEENMISDGCQWRKYGQKLSKGNPCPRAYYRCTMGSSCPVRKQVQRCAEDTTILTTTYEGHHNHALPTAAKAMASTTSAAASMLIAGSKSSSPFDGYLSTPIFSQPTALPGLPSLATISASAPFPTITLDLTQPQEMNNTTSSNTNGQDFIGLMKNLLSKTPNNFQTPNDPNKEGSNWSLIDLLSITKAALALDPNLASALATAISSVMKASFESDNVKHNTKDNNNSNLSNFDDK